MRRHIAGLALLTAVLAGCGDDPTEPEVITAAFELELTGSMEESVEGTAVFGDDLDEGGNPIWATVLGDADSRHVVVIGKAGASRPATGSFTVGGGNDASAWTILHIVSDGEDLVEIFLPESGTIRITESSARVVRGTFEFSATGMLGGPGSEIDAEGSFVAVPATELSIALLAGGS
jgi:hypothetical protein